MSLHGAGGIGAATGCAVLEGATAYVGSDSCKSPYTNYFLVDGTADDVQIQAALDYVWALGGGSVFLEAGTYIIAATVNLYGSILLQGAGVNSTILFLDNNVDDDVLEWSPGSTQWFLTINDLKIDGNKANNAAGCGFLMTGNNTYDLHMNDVWINDTSEACIKTAFCWGHRYVNVVMEDGQYGWQCTGGNSAKFIGCRISDCDSHGIYVAGTSRVTFIGLENENNGGDGVNGGVTNFEFIGGYFYGMTNGFSGSNTYGVFDDIYFQSCTTAINLTGGTQCKIGMNSYYTVTTPLADAGTDTILPSLVVPFVEPIGTAAWDVTAPGGIDVDVDTEGAFAMGVVPKDANEVVRVRVFAVGLAGPGAGQEMQIEFNMDSGRPDEPYNTEAIVVANKESDQTNFAVNDIVTWTITDADDVDLDDMFAGDCFEVRVMHEAGTGGDADTDALFRCVEIQYV